MVEFVVGLKASAARVQTLPAPDLARRMLAEYGRSQLFEWYHACTVGKVCFDVDGKADQGSAEDLLASALRGVETFFGCMPRVLIAASHGGDKLSFRLYVTGYRMKVEHIKKRLARLGLDRNRPFDDAIYGKNQKLRMAGSIKTSQDTRVLKLIDRAGRPVQPTEALLLDTLVQVVDDSWELLEETAPPAKRARLTRARAPPPPTPATPSTPATPQDDNSDGEEEIPIGGGHAPDEATAVPLLEQAGFSEVRVCARKPPFLKFDAARTRACACCQQTHERQLWFCTRLLDGQLYVKSYSPRCQGRRLAPAVGPEEQAEVERQLATLRENVDVVCATTRNLVARHKHIIDSSLKGAKMDLATVRSVDLADSFGFRSCKGRTYIAQNIIQTLYSVTLDRANAAPVLAGYSEADVVQSILHNPRGADESYATWFIGHQALHGVTWKSEPGAAAGQLYRHTGTLWAKVTDGEFEALFATTALPKMKLLHSALSATIEGPFGEEATKKRALKQVAETIKHLQNARASRAMLAYARLLTVAPDFGASLDRDRHLLGTPSGVLDLRTGQLTSATEALPVSMSVRPRWRGLDTPTPDVDAFFRMIFADDAPMVDYMQALLGAAITGERLEVYACFVGAGANGKGVTVGWLRHVLGPYYKEADPYIFFGDKRHGTGPTPALAELDRKRVAVVDESAPTDELNVAIVKRVTGTDVISCRQLYRDPMEMPVTHTQILLTNNLPKFDVDDQALERRIVVIPFNLKFVKDADYNEEDPQQRRADPTLARFLEGDSPSEQLLVWLVHGATRFYAAGNRLPSKPRVVRDAERGYYQENDILGQLITDRCTIGDGFVVRSAAFNSIARAAGVGHGIKNAMLKRGHAFGPRKVDGVSTNVYIGLRFNEELMSSAP